jgi:diguanylate cyclase (GGDEF)-like protein
VRAQRSTTFYSDLMFALTMQHYTPCEAEMLWNAILAHRDRLREQLGRNPGIVVAAVDYLSNLRGDCTSSYAIVAEAYLDDVVEQAAVDSLTGLYDHDMFMSQLEREIESARRNETPLSLLMIDLDDFKTINDRYGHPTGDEVLVAVAAVIRRALRAVDIGGRYGGEEFIVALPGADTGHAVRVGERVREAINSEGISRVAVTTSIGIAGYPLHGENTQRLVSAADQALYRAKQAGKNRVVVFDTQIA